MIIGGLAAIVFRTIGDQVSLWESLLPEEVVRLPGELARVDVLLPSDRYPTQGAPQSGGYGPQQGASFRGRRGCAGRMMDGSAWLVAVVRCCTSLGEQVALPRDELLDGLRGSAGEFFDRSGQAVIPILAM